MAPLKHLGSYPSRNIEESGSFWTWAWFVLLSPFDLILYSPADGCHNPGSGITDLTWFAEENCLDKALGLMGLIPVVF